MKLVNKKFKKHGGLILRAGLAVLAVVIINILSYRWFLRQDLTANGLYSISPATKRVIKNLPDTVNINVYFSKDLPSQFLPVRQELTDTLTDYQGYGNKLKVKYVDIGDGKEAEAAGIPKLQFNDYKQDKLEVVAGYMGLVINYKDKKEVMSVVQNTANFEYDLTTRIKKLTADQAQIGWLAGHGTIDFSGPMVQANQELNKYYKIKEVTLKNLPADIKTLVIDGPRDNFSDDELKALDNFLIKGNAAIVLVDGVTVDQGTQAAENKTNLIDFLQKYNIKVNRNLVVDTASGVASFNQGLVNFSLPYLYWPKILQKNFDQANPLVSGLSGVILPWPSSIDVAADKINKDVAVSNLIKSSNQSWTAPASTALDPGQKINLPSQLAQNILGVGLTGKIKSAYGEKTADNARLFVVADSDFARDSFWKNNQPNMALLQNLLDGANLDGDLISIRSKSIADRAIVNVSEANKEWLRYLNIFGITIVILAGGLARYYYRRKTKEIEI